MKGKEPGAHESHNVALNWAMAFLCLSGQSKTGATWGGGGGSTVPDARSPCLSSPLVLAEGLGTMELPRPLSVPPVARVLYLGGDVKAG